MSNGAPAYCTFGFKMKSYYNRVTDIGRRKEKILYLSTFHTLLLTLDEKCHFSDMDGILKDYVDVLIGTNAGLVVNNIFSEIRENYIFLKAGINRALEYVDNSFDTNFGDKNMENYFTQEN